jgi:hypothetical protein
MSQNENQDMSEFDEPRLLRLVMALYEIDHLSEEPRKAFADITGHSAKHISKCMQGGVSAAHLGDEAWAKIISACGVRVAQLRSVWLAELARRANNAA